MKILKLSIDDSIIIGLGACLSHLMLLNNSQDKIILYLRNKTTHERFKLLSKFFKFKNIYIHPLNPFSYSVKKILNLSENSNFFSEYPELNETYTNNSRDKKNRIGVSFYPFDYFNSVHFNREIFEILKLNKVDYENSNLKLPFNKYVSLDSKNIINDYLKKNNYKIINFDEFSASDLKFKIKKLQEIELLITYEGGLAHLAHCMNIPTIIWNWNKFINYNNFFKTTFVTEVAKQYNLNDLDDCQLVYDPMLLVQSLHLSRNTFFINKALDILDWSKQELDNVIEKLKNNEGNNLFLNNTFYVDEIVEQNYSQWPVYNNCKVKTFKGTIDNKKFDMTITKDVFNFIKNKCTDLKVANTIPIIFNK